MTRTPAMGGLRAEPSPRAAGIRSLRLVVAEDDAALRRLLVFNLAEAGHQVAEAHHGLQLLDLLTAGQTEEEVSGSFDVVVTDQHMPGLTGLGVVEALSRLSRPTRTVLMSAFVDEDLLARATHLGVSVLSKPFEFHLLLSAVERAFEAPAACCPPSPNAITPVP